jgi:hypothetical protein
MTKATIKGADVLVKDRKKSPSKEQYDKALKTIKDYENRQADLIYLEKELSLKLAQFDQIKFEINKKTKEVLFSGLDKASGKLVVGKSKCSPEDEFVQVIGKLIAVKTSLKESVENVVKHVEPNSFIQFTIPGNINNHIHIDANKFNWDKSLQ